MDIQTEKIELAKKLLDTENQSIIDAIESVFKNFDSNEDWEIYQTKLFQMQKSLSGKLMPGWEYFMKKVREMYNILP